MFDFFKLVNSLFQDMLQFSGHDYYGRSSAPNSLMIWTHSMRDIEFHDNFIPAGSPNSSETFKAVTLGAGLTWMDVYAAASVDRNLVSWMQYTANFFMVNNIDFFYVIFLTIVPL